MRFPGFDADLLMLRLSELEISQASACHYGVDSPSHVVTAMGYSRAEAMEFIRVSFGHTNTEDDARSAAEQIHQVVTSGNGASS